MSLSFKFCKDPLFCWGAIPLFVAVYDLELKIKLFSKAQKNAILTGKKSKIYVLQFIFALEIFYLITKNEWVEWTRIEETTCIFLMECCLLFLVNKNFDPLHKQYKHLESFTYYAFFLWSFFVFFCLFCIWNIIVLIFVFSYHFPLI